MAGSSKRDGFLDGWRALAALAVVMLHAVLYRLDPKVTSLSLEFDVGNYIALINQIALKLVFHVGDCAVPVFFMISGFIITALLLKEENEQQEVNLAAFYVRRTFRILPAMFLYIGAIVVLAYFGLLTVSSKTLLASSSFTCNIVQCDWWLAHYWSLAFEEQFYLAWPLLFVFFRRDRFTLALVITVLTFGLAIAFPYLSALAFLAIGALFAIARGKMDIQLPSWLAVVGLLSFVITAMIPSVGVLIPIKEASKLVVLPILFFGSMYNAAFRRALDQPYLSAIGRMSYGLYLWQQLFFGPKISAFMDFHGMEVVLLPLIVYVSYHYFEMPLINIGRRISTRLSGQNPQVA